MVDASTAGHALGDDPALGNIVLRRTVHRDRPVPILLLVVHDLVVGFDHIVGLAAWLGACTGPRGRLLAGAAGLSRADAPPRALLLVERLSSLTVRAGQLFLGRPNLGLVIAAQRLARTLDRPVELAT